jgi:hypothetical protein
MREQVKRALRALLDLTQMERNPKDEEGCLPFLFGKMPI